MPFLIPNKLSKIPVKAFKVDAVKSKNKFTPPDPLPKTSFLMYIVGMPKSGKTHLWTQMMLSGSKPGEPKYYYKWFAKTHLFSGSLDTLIEDVPVVKDMLNAIDKDENPDPMAHLKITDDLIYKTINRLREDKNDQYLFIIDDLIMDIHKSKAFAAITFNRRHCTQDSSKKGTGGLAIMLVSQKYNELKLTYRTVCSDIVLFRTNNSAERNTIRRELMGDLNPDQQDQLMEDAWREDHSFLFIKATEPTRSRYYINFDLYVFDETPLRKNKKKDLHAADERPLKKNKNK